MTDPARAACRERCAEAGDPPCWRFDDDEGTIFVPCSECLADAGIPSPPPPRDPDAAIGDLF